MTNKRVVIIDTSNEIAGIFLTQRLVGHVGCSSPELQHQVMIEAVENHMPEVIVIDEIEAMAARTIAERGVQRYRSRQPIENLIPNTV